MPVPDVRVQLKLAGEQALEETTDASGAARFLLPDAGKARCLSVTASREGYVPLAIPWVYTATSPTPPDRLLFQMEKGTTISGHVVDQDQSPVADATVVVWVASATRSRINGSKSGWRRPKPMRTVAGHSRTCQRHRTLWRWDHITISSLRTSPRTGRRRSCRSWHPATGRRSSAFGAGRGSKGLWSAPTVDRCRGPRSSTGA